MIRRNKEQSALKETKPIESEIVAAIQTKLEGLVWCHRLLHSTCKIEEFPMCC